MSEIESTDNPAADLHALLDALREGFQVIDFDYRYAYLNLAAAAQGKSSRPALLGRRMEECYPGIEDTEMFAGLRKCMTERVPFAMLNPFEFPDGTHGWFELRIEPVDAGVCILSIDATTRLRSEARLRALSSTIGRISAAGTIDEVRGIAAEAAREIFDGARAVVAVRDADDMRFLTESADNDKKGLEGHVLPVSSCAVGLAVTRGKPIAILDVEADELVPRGLYDGLNIRGVLATPMGPAAALAVYWPEPRTVLPEEAELLGMLAESAHAAIAKAEAYRALAEREALLDAIQQALPSALFTFRHTSTGTRLAEMNEAARSLDEHMAGLLGAAPDELETAFPGIGAQLRRCLAAKRTQYLEVEAQGDEGRHFELTLTYVPGDLVVVRANDVTRSREIERRTRASQRLEAVGQLAAGVAHDFNNLLTVINSYTEISLENIDGLEPTQSFLEEVLEAGQRAASLTAQLLAFSRRQMLAPEALSLNVVIDNVVPMLRRVLSENIEIVLHLSEELGTTKVDPAQLEHMLVNLAINARDAMPQGGTLTVSTQNVVLYPDTHPWLLDSAIAPGPYVMVAVTDDGDGMTPETLDRIFEPFFTTKHFGRGTGLGLATVHGIVTQSGGHVQVTSAPGAGTAFEIFLPRIDAPSTLEPDPTTGETTGVETILVAEDERALRALVERVLTSAGYTVIVASNGEEALELVERHNVKCELLVTDVVMPKLGGRELAERATKTLPDLRVLFISGYTEDTLVELGRRDASNQFLAKPFSARDLLKRVRRLLDA